MPYRYTLEIYRGMKSRYTCPGCRKAHTFSRYIDTVTGNHVADHVGRCSREVNCAYHYTPKQHYEDTKPLFEVGENRGWQPLINTRPKPKPVQMSPASTIPFEAFKSSLQAGEPNCLERYLTVLFGAEMAAKAISRYFIGTSKYWEGATVFWQIDRAGKIKAGKVMLYHPNTGKRVKAPYNHITWMHKVLHLSDYQLQQCLFGEHLLKADLHKPCALVESEKTAVIASVYLPQFVWLAVGSLSNLNADKCQVLKGRSVTLFPDLNGFEKWQAKAKELSRIARFVVSDLLERKATEAEKAKGLDLADYLIRFPYTDFQAPKVSPGKREPAQTESEPINITIAEVASTEGGTRTGKDFNCMIIAGYKTKKGEGFDLLFDADEELIDFALPCEAVERLARFFDKDFRPGYLDGVPCLIHIYK